MKTKLIAIALILANLLTCMTFIASAEIDEERVYVLAGEKVVLENQAVTPKSKAIRAVNAPKTEAFSLYSYPNLDDSLYANRGVILRYDISEIPESADKITITVGVSNRSSKVYSKHFEQNVFELGVYALENGKLNNTWTLNTPWSEMFNEEIPASDFRKDKIASMYSRDMVKYEDVQNAASTLYGGYYIETEITEHVKAQKANGAEVVDLYIAIDDYDPEGGTVASGNLTINIMTNGYSPDANDKNGRSTPLKPRIRWYDVIKSEINTLESITVENGYLSEEFDKDALDEAEQQEKTYTVGVVNEDEPVKISYEKTSKYSVVSPSAVTEGNIGDTLMIPVTSEAGVTRTYKFNLVSMEDAGYTEDGKIVAEEFDYDGSEIIAKIKNNSSEEKTAVIVVNELKDKKTNKINVFEFELTPGYSNITKGFNKLSSTTDYSMYVADKENIFAPLSSVVSSGVDNFEKREGAIEIYFKDITKEELTVSGKWNASETSIAVFVLNDKKDIADYDGTNEKEVFNYAGAMMTDEYGYYGFDVAMPSSNDYTIYVADGEGNVETLPIYYASVAEKENALNDIYGSVSEEELKGKLNLSLTEEEREELKDKYIETDGLEGQKDYVKILALKTEGFANGVSEDNFIKLLYNSIKEDTNKENFAEKYDDALIIATVNSGVCEDISAYDEIILDADILDIYNEYSANAKANISENKLSGKNFESFAEISEFAETIIILSVFEELDNPNTLDKIISEYKEILNISDVVSDYNKLVNSRKNKVVNALVDGAPYSDADEFAEKFAKEVKKQKDSKKENAGGGGSSGGSGTGVSQSFDVTGNINKTENVTPDVIESQNKFKFTDMTGYEWAEEAVKSLYMKGVINGVSDTSFNPSGEVKREEFVKMISALYEGNSNDVSFNDTDKTAWYIPYINKAVTSGIIKGISETEFGVGLGVTREDMAVIIYRILKGEKVETTEVFADDSSISDYAKDAVNYLKMKNLVSGTGNGNYEPKRVMTRAEAAVVINNIMNAQK